MVRRTFIFVAGVALAMLAAFVVVQPALATAANAGCTTCHATTGTLTQWDVLDVSRGPACKKCHTPGMLGSHPIHYGGANCGATCHPGWGSSNRFAVPGWVDPVSGATFANAESMQSPAAVIHSIHSRSTWIAGLSTADSQCASCHSAASCTACHEDAVAHGAHSSTGSTAGTVPLEARPSWTGVTAHGVSAPTYDQSVLTAYSETNQCATPECHNLQATSADAPLPIDVRASGVTAVGTWRYFTNSNFAGWGGQSNIANAALTFAFSGTRFEILTDKDPYRGKFAVSIDAGPETIIDCYDSVTTYQEAVYRSPALTAGTHTVKVRVTGTKNTSARGAYVAVDGLRFNVALGDSISPACLSMCHADKATNHGFDHLATAVTGTEAGITCASCHSTTLTTEHSRTSSSTSANGCTACHTTYADYTLDAYAKTCGPESGAVGGPTCHVTASASERHTGYTSGNVAHTVTAAEQTSYGVSGCVGCHGDAIDIIHDAGSARLLDAQLDANTITSNCLTCHSATAVPSVRDCDASGCHADLVHPATEHNAAPASDEAAAPRGGSLTLPACDTCHALNATFSAIELVNEHFKGSSKTTLDAAIACDTCHAAAYLPAGWMTPPANTCIACHPADGTKAGASHEVVEYGTKHDFSTYINTAMAQSNDLSCGGIGCHNTAMADVLHQTATGGGVSGCAVCHTTAVRDSGVPATYGCSDCHPDKVAGNHGKLHALNLTGSDYAEATQSGCTNSGAGCHGVSTSLDIADYHATTLCSTSACHKSVDKPTHHEPFMCTDCHDGTYAGAKDTTPLTDLGTAGHFEETSHTVGADTSVSSGGSASAMCSDCHSPIVGTQRGLYAQHQGFSASQVASPAVSPSMACAQCHNYSAAITSVITAKWPTKTCVECHDGTAGKAQVQHSATAPAVTGTSPQSCGDSGTNCHATSDLHALHKNAAGGCSLTGCHDYTKQGLKPTDKSCGSGGGTCHTTYTEDAHYTTHKSTHTSTLQGSATYWLNGQSPTCASCHGMELNAEHALGTSAMSGTGSVCLKCHNNAGSTTAITGLWTGELCSACHGVASIPAQHTGVANHMVTNVGCGSSGAGCHNTSDLSMAGTDKSVNIHNDCVTCHDPAGATSWTYGVAGNMTYNPLLTTCGGAIGCHTNAFYSATAHNIGQPTLVNGIDAKHTAAAVNMDDLVGAYTQDNACASCHSDKLLTAHATTSLATDAGCTAGGTDGKGCHNSTVLTASPAQVKSNWTNKACADCHTTSHDAFDTGHTSSATAGCTLTSGCHGSDGSSQSLDVRVLHDTANAAAGCSGSGQDSKLVNNACHALDKPMSGTGMTCGTGGACHSSHTASNHMPDHLATTVASLGCTTSGCHEAGAAHDVSTTSVIDLHSPTTIGATVSGKTNNGCNICHGDASWTDVAQTAKTNLTGFNCEGCHNGTLVGAHVYTPHDPNHYTNTTAHTASGQTGTEGGLACSTCHQMEMKPEHITKTTSVFSTVPGTHADKCVACHEVKADSLGTWNLTCDACHASKHTAMPTAHDATSVGAGCAGSVSYSTTVETVASENFDAGSTWPAGWSVTGSPVVSSVSASSTPNALKFASSANGTAQTATIVKTIDTSAMTNPKFSFAYSTSYPTIAGTPTSELIYPSGVAGAETWTETPTNGWATCLDTNDGATTGISIASANAVQNVDVDPSAAGAGTINSVTVRIVANTATNEMISYGVVSGGTPSVLDSTGAMTTTFASFTGTPITLDPSDGLAWTWADIDALQMQFTAVKNGGGAMGAVTVTQAYIDVNYSSSTPANPATNYLKAEVYDGSGWTTVLNQTADSAWATSGPANLPVSPNTQVRITLASDRTDRTSYVDDILVTKEVTTQQGTSCHNTADVAAIHNNSVVQTPTDNPSDCASSCHTSNTTLPTTITCTDSACHGTTAHVAVHTSSRIECTSCHGATNIQTIHSSLGDGCNVCHGGGGYTDVHIGKTADCVDCHNATGVGIQKNYSPIAIGHYVGTETLHDASLTQSGDVLGSWALSPTCGQCHDMNLYNEHNATTSAKTTVPANVCENCHLSTVFSNSSTVVSTNWLAKTGTSACIACHALDTTTNQHGQTAITGNHAVTDSANNCGASGNGCHPTANVSQVGTASTTGNIHTACTVCHGTTSRAKASLGTGALTGGCASGATYCHNSATYASTTNHATDTHSAVTGDDALHTATGMTSLVDAYTYGNACSSCHSATLLTAHTSASNTTLGTGRTAWSSTAQSACRDCHNAATTTGYAASGDVIKGNWSTDTCADCHTTSHATYTVGTHTATATAGCTLTSGCHGYVSSQSLDVRALHDRVTSGCTATGTDGKGWTGGCHALDKQMPTGAMTCGATGLCHTGHSLATHGPDHNYDTSSNYAQTGADVVGGESGCTASGTGCHDSATTGDAINTFHSAVQTGCTSADACHSDPEFSTLSSGTTANCSRCHGGAGGAAVGSDNQPLYEASSLGHYDDALHTGVSGQGTVSAGGAATAACDVCHDLGLRNAHGAAGGPLATGTKGSYVTCQECHAYNANVTNEVKTLSWQNNTCADCHNSTDMATSVMHSATTAPAANITAVNSTGCGGSGAGCHGTNFDLHTIHKDSALGCTLTGCHSAKNSSPVASAMKCGQATGCHLNTTYTPTNHNGATGDDAAKHEATGNAGQSVDAATYTLSTTTCVTCHTMTMSTGHAATSTNGGSVTCAECHSQTTPVNANGQVTSDWTARTCEACHTTKHTTYAGNHTASLGTGCTIGSCHLGAGSTDVRAIHNRVFSNPGTTPGCSAAGSDSLYSSNPTCHALNKPMSAMGTMSCGSGGSGTTKCHVNHTNTNHGVGGGPCLGCHGATSTERLDKMVNDTTTYHHVLDAATPDTQANLTSTSVLGCRSCHVDHGFATKATNLKTGVGTTVAAKTDYSATAPFGICLSCHTSAVTRTTTAQKAGGNTAIDAVTQSTYNTSKHNYIVNNASVVGFGTDAFQPNCIKCHNSSAMGVARQTGTKKIAPHLSPENRLASALGVANVGATTVSEENLCFVCHTGTTGVDAYGVAMSARSQNIAAQFAKTSKHNVAGYAGIHTSSEYTAAPTSIGQATALPGWWGTGNANKHVECDDCHNVHEAQAATNNLTNDNASPRTSLPTISGANLGVWGVTVGGTGGDWNGSATIGGGVPVGPTYTKTATAAYEWQLCLKCHSRYAWGNQTVPAVPSGGMNNRGASTMTDVGKDFDPANYAYHPVFREGLNTPPVNANTAWTGASAGRRNIAGNTSTNGLSNTFVDGWLYTSRVTCTDCHGNNDWSATGSRGPHGSGQAWLLRGANTAVKVTIASGAVNNCNGSTLATSFCQNCHRADVYGNGAGGNSLTTMYGSLARADHPSSFGSCDANTFQNPYAGCTSCHGGRPSGSGTGASSGLIHGTSAGIGVDGGDPMGWRFCNGAAWNSHQTGKTGTIGCSTLEAGDAYSSCAKHTGGGFAKTFTAEYPY